MQAVLDNERVFKFPTEGVTITTPKGYRVKNKHFKLDTMKTPPPGKNFIRPVFSFDLEKKVEGEWEKVPTGGLEDGEVIRLRVRYTAADAKLAAQEGELPTLVIAWGDDDTWELAAVDVMTVSEDPALGGEAVVEFRKADWKDPRIGWAD